MSIKENSFYYVFIDGFMQVFVHTISFEKPIELMTFEPPKKYTFHYVKKGRQRQLFIY